MGKHVILNNCLCEFLGVVRYSAKSEGSTVLDGDGGVQEEGTKLLQHIEGVEIVNVLRFRCEVGDLLCKFYF